MIEITKMIILSGLNIGNIFLLFLKEKKTSYTLKPVKCRLKDNQRHIKALMHRPLGE